VTDAAYPLLATRGLTKRFTGTLALDRVDLDVRRGEVHALLGENGAGKSTLIKILAGVYRADAGEIRLGGELVDPAAQPLPIAFIHQDLGLVESMTVAENVAQLTGYARAGGLIAWKRVRETALRALRMMGSDIDPEANVQSLSASDRSIVAIGRALAVQTDVLVLDEPTAALTENDVARLLDVLRRLRTQGVAIVYVTHRLDEVFRIADRVTVLRDGKRIATTAVRETTPKELVHMIVGRALADVFVKPPPPSAQRMLEVDGLTVGAVGPASFTVMAGEVLGLVGLRGAGHDVVGRAIFADVMPTAGRFSLAGRAVHVTSPAQAMRRRIGFVSSKRAEDNLAIALTVRENLYINPVATSKGMWDVLFPQRERRAAAAVLRRFSVRPPEPERIVGTLSGGNQQKVVLARWLEAQSALLVLEEPTIGVDVGAKTDICTVLQGALDRGMAVLLISSDFEEVAGIAHRALVFNRGKVVAEVAGANISVRSLIALASGTAGSPSESAPP
jgi:ribose transport system ATP-binding protein